MQQLLIERKLEHAPRAQGGFPVRAAFAQGIQQVCRAAARPLHLFAARWLQQLERTKISNGDHDFRTSLLPVYRSSVVSEARLAILHSLTYVGRRYVRVNETAYQFPTGNIRAQFDRQL